MVARDWIWKAGRTGGLLVARHWPWPVCATLRSGHPIYVDLRSALGRGVFMKHGFDPSVSMAISDRLSPGGVFLDVGANIGVYTVEASEAVGASGAVHAFEIDPRALRCLRRTLTLGLPNVRLHPVAIGEMEGRGVMIAGTECGHSRVRSTGEGMEVPITSLDAWRRANPGPRVTLVKLDIEGGELGALRGARNLLEEDRPAVVCEADAEMAASAGESLEDLVDFLRKSVGYRVEWVKGAWSPTIVADP